MARNVDPAHVSIHILDDDDDILQAYEDVLTSEGHTVTLAKIPFEHPRDVERLHPDLIILDLKFGLRMDGWKLLQLLRMYQPTAAIPVIVCTAAVHEAREQEAHLQSQGIVVVYKPFTLDTLFAAMRTALGLRGRATDPEDGVVPPRMS